MKVPLSAEEMQERFPQFEILECLGRGGMGVVYKARQKALDRMVAIKVLAGERQGEVDFARRFEREAKLLAQMSHANIVTVHDFGEADGLYYIVMEYVDGVNLRDLLQDGKMDPKQALAIVPRVCEALQYAHDRGVVHRDIKPENLLLDREGRVKIADFGIATLVGTDAERSGTPPYMAPEQQAAKGVDHRADIYALGVVFYEMLTGERPARDPSRPSRRVAIDVRLDEVVLRALEKEPARRYQTAGEFRTVVETVAAKTPTEEPPSSREVRPPAAAPAQAASFSRTAILGAIWGPLFFIAFVPMFAVYSVPAGQSHGPEWWQYLLLFTLLPLGLAAPFGTTILGSVALTQIRRSAGKLYGLGLALFDVLLFPLLALDALIGGFWLLLFRAFASSIGGYLQPTPVNVLLATLVTAIIIDVLIVRWAWRAANKPVGDGVPAGATPETTAPRKSRMKFAVIIGLVIAAVSALLFWAQQPRMIDERTIAADSPDEMFSAMGQTWHSMRIMGGDRTFYVFIVQGRAGAVFERWEVPVPTEKLATSYTALSLDEILFGKHGKIVWSDDGKRVSFQVNGIEVAGFDTESGKPMEPREGQETVLQVPPRFSEWQVYTLHDLESGGKDDGCLNLSRGHMDTLTEERWRSEQADALLTVEFASAGMALAVGGAEEFHLIEVGKEVARDPQRVVQLLQDSTDMMPEDGHEVIEVEGGIFHVLPQDVKGRIYAFAVAMPRGLPVAGLIEIGQADREAETLRIRHRGLEVVEADLPVETQRIRDRILSTTQVFEEDAGATAHESGGAETTPEHAARNFMTAIRDGDIDAAMKWMSPEMKAHASIRKVIGGLSKELREEFYAGKLDQLTKFTEWYPENHDANTRFVGAQTAGVAADDGTERLHGLYLILSPTSEGWKVAHLDDAYSDQPLSHYVDRIVRILPGEGPLFRQQAAERPIDSVRTEELESVHVDTPRSEIGEPGPAKVVEDRVLRKVQLPDADTADGPKVLDLASGKLLEVSVEGEREIIAYFDKLGQGDLAWDNGLGTLRGARVNEWKNGVWKLLEPDRESMGCAVYRLELPRQLLVTTAEGTRYAVEVSAGTDDGVVISYHRDDVVLPPEALDDKEDVQPDVPPRIREEGPIERAQAVPVTPPDAMPDDSLLSVEQLKQVLEGVTWGGFIATFADEGHQHEVSWTEVESKGEEGHRFEIGFPLGGERMLLDLAVDPEFQHAVPSRLRPARNSDQVETEAATKFLLVMVMRYALKSGHPVAAPAVEKARDQARQAIDLSTMRSYKAGLRDNLTSTRHISLHQVLH